MPTENPFVLAHRLQRGGVDLSGIDTDGKPAFDGQKREGQQRLAQIGEELADLQERLFAARGTGSRSRVLLVLQGMDTSGKGGALRHAISLVDPQGVRITSFKAPTEEELAHDFLWRIRKAVPEPGYVGVFDRSHYEDVLIGRVRGLAPEDEIEARYARINAFEEDLVRDGVSVVKCMLHISAAEQKERLLARLDDPTKHWKFTPGDIDEREMWKPYQEAYEVALERTNTRHAPWLVIPSDRKWYRNLAVAEILLDTLRGLDLHWPVADFDIDTQRRRLLEEDPVT